MVACFSHLCAGQKVRDLRTWLTSYAYWNQVGGTGML